MALIVEDGSGAEDSDSYLSVADFKAACARLGFDLAPYNDTLIEQALRRATQYLDYKYRSNWLGTKVNGRSQALAWPRTDLNNKPDLTILDGDGAAVAVDAIPAEITAAVVEIAKRECVTPGGLNPDLTTQRVLSEQVGPIRVTYADVTGDGRPVLTLVDEMVSNLLAEGIGSNTNFHMRA